MWEQKIKKKSYFLDKIYISFYDASQLKSDRDDAETS